MQNKTETIVNDLTDYLNSFSNKSPEFNLFMSSEHRTLQQSFTRLCLGWIEHVASDEYRTDGRNEGSKEICKKLLDLFKNEMKLEGFSGETLELMSKPSGYCTMI